MEKEVLISIRGMQFEGSVDGENIETITRGNYYKRNDHHYVLYEEMQEGYDGITQNILKFNDSEFSLTKKGLVNVQMIFEEKRKNMTNYETPYGTILFGIDAREIRVEEQEDRIGVRIDYALEINYEHLADCKIIIEVVGKDTKGFSLQRESS